MARLITVDDAADSRLSDYVALRDVQLRKHLEAEHGFFIAEGEKVIRRAVGAGYDARSFLLTERWLPGLSNELEAVGDAPCYVVTEALAEQVTGFHVHRGALASMRRRPLPPLDEILASSRRIVLLEDIVDHTNVGAIARNAAALGIDAMVLSPRCADPFYRRSIKVAMGAVFTLPWTRIEGWYDAVRQIHDAGFTTVALTPADDADDLAAFSGSGELDKVCIIVGSEGPGISQRWLASADRRVRIAMTRDVDSLNVAAAAAVVFYALQQPMTRKEPGG